MTIRLLITFLTFSYSTADDSKVKYTDDGAIITGLGFITLNNPDPITFELDDYRQCRGDLHFCYKALTPSIGSSPPCELGFQKVVVIKLSKTIGFRDTMVGSKFQSVLARDSAYGIPPDEFDGLYHYQILELPKNCDFKILGATDPNPPDVLDSSKTTKLVIYILVGVAVVILLSAIGVVIYCVCCKHKNEASRSIDESSAVKARSKPSRANPTTVISNSH